MIAKGKFTHLSFSFSKTCCLFLPLLLHFVTSPPHLYAFIFSHSSVQAMIKRSCVSTYPYCFHHILFQNYAFIFSHLNVIFARYLWMCYTTKLKMLSFYSEFNKRLYQKLLLIPVSIEKIIYYLSFHLLMK